LEQGDPAALHLSLGAFGDVLARHDRHRRQAGPTQHLEIASLKSRYNSIIRASAEACKHGSCLPAFSGQSGLLRASKTARE
jgi:hypothetical protein